MLTNFTNLTEFKIKFVNYFIIKIVFNFKIDFLNRFKIINLISFLNPIQLNLTQQYLIYHFFQFNLFLIDHLKLIFKFYLFQFNYL